MSCHMAEHDLIEVVRNRCGVAQSSLDVRLCAAAIIDRDEARCKVSRDETRECCKLAVWSTDS